MFTIAQQKNSALARYNAKYNNDAYNACGDNVKRLIALSDLALVFCGYPIECKPDAVSLFMQNDLTDAELNFLSIFA